MSILTIGMPVYNDVNFIEASINSILNQTFRDFILIIADDCSSDGSAEICQSYAARDSRIIYIRHTQNIGISKNMKFLLNQSSTEYFMWAADDDLWSSNFIEQLLDKLTKEKDAVVSFCTFATIDEKGDVIKDKINFDYNNENVVNRLNYFISNSNDAFGYGMFRANKIKNVEFPTWWWPNQKCAYNNIYPTLCYYLAVGNYCHVNGNAAFFNRIKSNENINHKLPYRKGGIKEIMAYIIRKINLVSFSFKSIRKADNFFIALRVSPNLCIYWFIIPVGRKIKNYFKRNLEK